MPENADNPLSFWQELKRRKVIRVITVYAAAAFVILELVSIIEEPFGLPDWTLKLVFVILCIGLIISIILSWIYDITPKGIEKTKPSHEIKEKVPEKPSQLKAWKIATAFSVVIIAGLIIFHAIGERKPAGVLKILDKSIAVLPFTYLGDEPDKQYLADGTMDEILLNLSKIKDLRVMSKTSVEQYRNTDKTITEICKELDVAFLLEGSFQKSDNQVRLIVQLIKPGKEDHAWAKKYDRVWQDIFAVQSEVAQLVAQEIQAVITPNEKQLIEVVPTTSLTAYDFFQRGRAEHMKYWLDSDDKNVLERAEDFYKKAIEYDSTFAQAYTGLAWLCFDKHYWGAVITENFLDSMLILADIALSYDDQLAEAYEVRGDYYRLNYNRERAINEYDMAIKSNPNDWWAYFGKGLLYYDDDLVRTIDNLNKAASLHRGYFLSEINRRIGIAYAIAGYRSKAQYYVKEALKLEDDSVAYYLSLARIEDNIGNYEKAIEFGKKSYTIDSTNLWVIFLLGNNHMFLGQFEESLEYFKRYNKRLKTLERPHSWNPHRIGYAYWINGFQEEAEYYINTGLVFYSEMIKSGRHQFQDFNTFYALAAIYTFLGDKNKAYENLRLFNHRQRMPIYMTTLIKVDPLFDNIRDEPEFQQIVQDIAAKYQAEHERVRQWLEENEML